MKQRHTDLGAPIEEQNQLRLYALMFGWLISNLLLLFQVSEVTGIADLPLAFGFFLFMGVQATILVRISEMGKLPELFLSGFIAAAATILAGLCTFY